MPNGTFIIAVTPKRSEFDPLAHGVTRDLVEAGVPAAKALVISTRLVRLEGEISLEEAKKASEALLVDPVVETCEVFDLSKKRKGKGRGFVLDVWPKPGVTDPVAETVQKGLRDLGYFKIQSASSGIRYVFPKIMDPQILESAAKRNLANELVHAVTIKKANDSY